MYELQSDFYNYIAISTSGRNAGTWVPDIFFFSPNAPSLPTKNMGGDIADLFAFLSHHALASNLQKPSSLSNILWIVLT